MLQLVGGFKHDIVIVAAVDPHCQTDPYWLWIRKSQPMESSGETPQIVGKWCIPPNSYGIS